jgi:hypothetical protein
MQRQEHVRKHRHVDHRRTPSTKPPVRDRMPARKRVAIYSVLGALWFSGCAWLVLDQFFESSGQFGMTPHPWAPAVLLVHGIIAILSMYLLGWITARHVLRWWPGRLRRLSGGVLAGFFVFFRVAIVERIRAVFRQRRPMAASRGGGP